jgi:hypothetical protein
MWPPYAAIFYVPKIQNKFKEHEVETLQLLEQVTAMSFQEVVIEAYRVSSGHVVVN